MRKTLPLMIITVCLTLFLASGCGSPYPLMSGLSVPGAMGEIKLKTDDNGNTLISLNVKHLANPEKLVPAKSVYVVWVETPEEQIMNLGQLVVDEDLEGSFSGTTPFRYFRILITGENEPTVTKPSSEVVLTSDRLKP